ncbi:MAG TPA: TetR/AcrR family transcriptional regulator [Mobilitalea sp.]|nr:TetR/AcrR family transcriptional regulator [Mobilitalea sp.]
MTSEEIKKNRIMDTAFKKFTTIGIQQVTMDDIARGVGMGKGTLYKYFPSKEILLMNTVDYIASRIEKSVEAVLSDDRLSPVDKVGIFLKTIAEWLSRINPSALAYLERSMPEAYEKLNKTRERIIMKNLVILFEDGKKSGIFDPKMDNYLVVHIFIGAIRHMVEERVISSMNYTLDHVFTRVVATIFQGCLTEEGRKLSYQVISEQSS